MAVITKYVVVRNGVELDRVFTVKKEAEAYDKMLDAADDLAAFIKASEFDIDIDEKTIDAISILLAKNGPEVVKMLKGIKPVVAPTKKEQDVSPEKQAPATGKKQPKEARSRRKTK